MEVKDEIDEEEIERNRRKKVKLMLKKMKECTKQRIEERKMIRRELKKVKINVVKKWKDALFKHNYGRNRFTRPSLYFKDKRILVTLNYSRFELTFWDLESFSPIKHLQSQIRRTHPNHSGRMVMRKWRDGTFLTSRLDGNIEIFSIETMGRVHSFIQPSNETRKNITNFIVLRSQSGDDDAIIYSIGRERNRVSILKNGIYFIQASYDREKQTVKFGRRDVYLNCIEYKSKDGTCDRSTFTLSKKFENCFYVTVLNKRFPDDTMRNTYDQSGGIFKYPVLVDYKKDEIVGRFPHPDDSSSHYLHSHCNTEYEEILFSYGNKFIYILETALSSSSSSSFQNGTSCSCLKKVPISQRSGWRTVLDSKIVFNKVLVVVRSDGEYNEERQRLHFFKISSNFRSLEYIWETNKLSRADNKDYGFLTFLSYEKNVLRFIASGVKSMLRIIRVTGIGKQYLGAKEIQELDLEERVAYLKETYLITCDDESSCEKMVVKLESLGTVQCVNILRILL